MRDETALLVRSVIERIYDRCLTVVDTAKVAWELCARDEKRPLALEICKAGVHTAEEISTEIKRMKNIQLAGFDAGVEGGNRCHE